MDVPDQVKSREELAQKLDKDLDQHIQNILEKNKGFKYKDGLDPDRLDEQLRLIPAFSKEAPTQEDIDASPALQALQALKYECDDPEACAVAHKDDGNYCFQRKEYKKAIIAYSEGLRQKHENKNLYAVLYTNRAACHFYLGNNGSALKDATWALKFDSSHKKAITRGAICCFDLEKYKECIEWCDKGLAIDKDDLKMIELKKKCYVQIKQKERDQRKKEMRAVKDIKKRKELIDEIMSRKINFENGSTPQHIEQLLNTLNKPESGKLYLDDRKMLHWPCYFVYPEFAQSDFIEDFSEDICFSEQLAVIFETYPPWDVEKAYSLKNIEIFFEDIKRNTLIKVNPTMQLGTLLSDKRFTMAGIAPVLMVMSKITEFYKVTLENQSTEDF
ncbi:tetratricopeptide repeat protein 4 isoform X1 [Hydra vulgaris]|uniref:tetratricopeptide repeat protein 4 isoform X1 n=1 Tax=Hydra vulgaris TaxID=6087 RepID=UPI001F5FBDD1|nr:tetratricopeptide repeat protein 4 [Hydra vulgaris]